MLFLTLSQQRQSTNNKNNKKTSSDIRKAIFAMQSGLELTSRKYLERLYDVVLIALEEV